jgi:hypothetical protein
MRERSIIIALILTTLVWGGCIFQPREATPPGTGGGGDEIVTLETPQAVFSAIAETLKSGLPSNYDRAIKDDFAFSALAADEADPTFGASVWANWDKAVEMEVLNQMLGDFGYLEVEFDPLIDINEEEYVRYRVDYTLKGTRLSAPTDTVTYSAIAHFDVRNDAGNWRLELWDEIEQKPAPGGGFYPSWGYLKATIRQQILGG